MTCARLGIVLGIGVAIAIAEAEKETARQLEITAAPMLSSALDAADAFTSAALPPLRRGSTSDRRQT